MRVPEKTCGAQDRRVLRGWGGSNLDGKTRPEENGPSKRGGWGGGALGKRSGTGNAGVDRSTGFRIADKCCSK